MKKYAITIYPSKEFYPDPIYTDLSKAKEKMNYLMDYRAKKNMPLVNYAIETLTKERMEQHNKEWEQWKSMID